MFDSRDLATRPHTKPGPDSPAHARELFASIAADERAEYRANGLEDAEVQASLASLKRTLAALDFSELDDAIDRLAALPTDSFADEALSEGLKGIGRRADRIQALEVGWVAEFQRRNLARKQGASTTAAWLKENCRLSGRAAQDRTRVAGVLDLLPETAKGLADGTVSLEQARPIADAARELDPEQIAQADRELARAAEVRDADEIRRRARRLRESDRRKAADKAMRMYRDRKVRTWESDGMLCGSWELPPEGGAYVNTMLEALKTKDPQGTPDAERRSREQRLADALVDAARLVANGKHLPDHEGERPHVLVTVDINTLTNPDDPESPPARLDHAGDISADTAIRIACDAGISRVLTDGPSLVIDVGRKKREPSKGTRRSVWVRDAACCRWSGCNNRIKQVHHIIHWTRGGPTDLTNLCGLCWFHHHLVHEGGWNLQGDANGTLKVFTPAGTLHATSDPPRL